MFITMRWEYERLIRLRRRSRSRSDGEWGRARTCASVRERERASLGLPGVRWHDEQERKMGNFDAETAGVWCGHKAS
eukprot:5857905-Pleurochrysis_carterae.AAC.4